jgi:hypothetical protein
MSHVRSLDIPDTNSVIMMMMVLVRRRRRRIMVMMRMMMMMMMMVVEMDCRARQVPQMGHVRRLDIPDTNK